MLKCRQVRAVLLTCSHLWKVDARTGLLCMLKVAFFHCDILSLQASSFGYVGGILSCHVEYTRLLSSAIFGFVETKAEDII